jgi:hypothetical protein
MSRDQHVASKFSWVFRNDIPSTQHALGLYLIIRMFYFISKAGQGIFLFGSSRLTTKMLAQPYAPKSQPYQATSATGCILGAGNSECQRIKDNAKERKRSELHSEKIMIEFEFGISGVKSSRLGFLNEKTGYCNVK